MFLISSTIKALVLNFIFYGEHVYDTEGSNLGWGIFIVFSCCFKCVDIDPFFSCASKVSRDLINVVAQHYLCQPIYAYKSNLWKRIFCRISRERTVASHRMLVTGLVLKAPMLCRMPWLWLGFKDWNTYC